MTPAFGLKTGRGCRRFGPGIGWLNCLADGAIMVHFGSRVNSCTYNIYTY